MTKDDEIQTLLREVELRPQPPVDLMQLAETASRIAWQEAVARHRTRNWQRFSLSAAAVLLLAFVLSFYAVDETGFVVEIAQAREFRVDHQPHGPGTTTLESGSHMTAVSPARLIAPNAIDVRLNAATRVSWLAPDHMFLESGTLYVDTHGTAAFHVSTREGRIRDIGTRYLVAVNAASVGLAVREGETEVETESRTVIVRGDGVKSQVVTLGQGNVVVTDEAASNDRWAWIAEVGPDYPDVDVRELLDQVCADLGKRLIFEPPGVEASIANQHLATGSLGRKDPSAALKAIVESSGLHLVESVSEVRIGF